MDPQPHMTRSELIELLALKFPRLTASDAQAAVEIILGSLTDELARGGRAEIRGFGSFSTRIRQARTGRNPKTGEAVSVPAKTTPHFKAGSILRERVDAK